MAKRFIDMCVKDRRIAGFMTHGIATTADELFDGNSGALYSEQEIAKLTSIVLFLFSHLSARDEREA